jgi:RNA polymerase sigma factor (sigma-70 family)
MKPVPSLAEVIASLPEEERVVLSLHYVKGMETADIAQTLGVPHKAVHTVMEQGKRRLFEALDFPPLA